LNDGDREPFRREPEVAFPPRADFLIVPAKSRLGGKPCCLIAGPE